MFKPEVERIVVVKGSELKETDETDRSICTAYIFANAEQADIVYTELKKRVENLGGEYTPSGLGSMDNVMSGLKALGVEKIVFLDASEVRDKLDGDELERSVIVMYVMPNKAVKDRYINLIRMAKRMGLI